MSKKTVTMDYLITTHFTYQELYTIANYHKPKKPTAERYEANKKPKLVNDGGYSKYLNKKA